MSNSQQKTICLQCLVPVAPDTFVTCAKCDKTFHYACCRVKSRENWLKTPTDKRPHWMCDGCQEIFKLQRENNKMSEKLENLKSHIEENSKTTAERLNTLQGDINNLTALIQTLVGTKTLTTHSDIVLTPQEQTSTVTPNTQRTTQETQTNENTANLMSSTLESPRSRLPDFSVLRESEDECSNGSEIEIPQDQQTVKLYFKKTLSPTITRKIRDLPMFRLYQPNNIINFLLKLSPIAHRNNNKFKSILSVLADREQDASTENFLYNALSYPKINFETFSTSLLKHGISARQYLQTKTKYLFCPQDENTSLREYVDAQIKLLKLFGENDERSNISNLVNSIHPKYLPYIRNPDVLQNYQQLYEAIKDIEINLNERYGYAHVPNFNKITYAAAVTNQHGQIPNFNRHLNRNREFFAHSNRYRHNEKNHNVNSYRRQHDYFPNREWNHNKNGRNFKAASHKNIYSRDGKDHNFGNPNKRHHGKRNLNYQINKNKQFKQHDKQTFAALNENIEQILKLQQLFTSNTANSTSSQQSNLTSKNSKN